MASTATATPMATMPATTVTPLPGYGYQGSAAGATPPQSSHGSGSIGTFFAVLAAVLLLTLLSCVFGRVCAGYAEGPDEQYDCVRLGRRWCRSASSRRESASKPPPPPVVVEVVPAALPRPEEP